MPLQPPEATQSLVLCADHDSVLALPMTMGFGMAESATFGSAGEGTLIVTLTAFVPPSPVHVRVNTVVVSSAPVVSVPLVARVPVQPPEAVQAVARLVDHVRVAGVLYWMPPGLPVNDISGGGMWLIETLAEAVPPAPVHSSW